MTDLNCAGSPRWMRLTSVGTPRWPPPCIFEYLNYPHTEIKFSTALLAT
jgi:hypothetical protein